MRNHDNKSLKKAGHFREMEHSEGFDFLPNAYFYKRSVLAWPVIVTVTPPRGYFDTAYIVLCPEEDLSYVSGTQLIYSADAPWGILIPKNGYIMATEEEFKFLWEKLPR
jgi:hypothetical protein